MSDMGITRNDCTAVYAAALIGEISDQQPINDSLMAPFVKAAESHDVNSSALEALKAVETATFSVSQSAFAGACGATKDLIATKVERVRAEVLKGLQARGWHA